MIVPKPSELLFAPRSAPNPTIHTPKHDRASKAKKTKFGNKPGLHTIDGRTIYFKSQLEVRVALALQKSKESGSIKDWQYECKSFIFPGLTRGVTSYKPDFKIIRPDGTHYWIECKGYMDAKSKTKLKRMKKYFPDEEVKIQK